MLMCVTLTGADAPMPAATVLPADMPPDIAWRWHNQRLKEMRREARAARWGGFPLYDWRLPVVIIAFFVFWPLGLALLAFLFWRSAMNCQTAGWSAPWIAPWKRRVQDAMERHGSSGNLAFDEHRAAVLARLEEERRALDAQQAEFAEFMRNLRRAKDQEEFDRFMAARDGKPA